MITKELLSKVLDREVKDGKSRIVINDNLVTFAYLNEDMWSDINVYELANLCKVWACEETGYKLKSGIYIKTSLKIEYNCTDYEEISEFAETEYEAIFKACNWILNETSN